MNLYPIGEAARLSGVGIETIRYYEREGVVPPAARGATGRRVYDNDAVVRLRFVRRCRDLGFAIADVRALLELAAGTAGTCGEVRSIATAHLDAVRAKRADLARLDRALASLVRECTDDRADCPILVQLFAD